MRFWDSSAVVPLFVLERSTTKATALRDEDPAMLVWWATEIECVSAVTRLERSGAITSDLLAAALAELDTLSKTWHEVEPTAAVRRQARRLLRTHDVRAADAFQLAAALQAAEGDPSTLEFVGRDVRLNDAARREGLQILDPAGD
jgi:uncharacterized protein